MLGRSLYALFNIVQNTGDEVVPNTLIELEAEDMNKALFDTMIKIFICRCQIVKMF